MKKILIPAVTLALLTASLGTWAHMPHEHAGMGQPRSGHQAMMTPEMRALQEDMHAKMAAAKTPEERQALMTEQHEKMRGKMPGMGGMGGKGGMGGMHQRQHHPMMQEQRPASGG